MDKTRAVLLALTGFDRVFNQVAENNTQIIFGIGESIWNQQGTGNLGAAQSCAFKKMAGDGVDGAVVTENNIFIRRSLTRNLSQVSQCAVGIVFFQIALLMRWYWSFSFSTRRDASSSCA